MMLRKIYRLLMIAALLPLLASCTDDWLFNSPDDTNGELPIDFSVMLPHDATRGFDADDDIKTKFSAGDVIHILGTFNIKYLNEEGEYEEGTISRYGALQYNAVRKGWDPVPGNNLTWPAVAVDGKFEAYYISGSNGVLTNDDPTKTYNLSTITANSDPLYAFTPQAVVYGHAVKLDFTHICAYLSLENLEPMVATEYWFSSEDVKEADGTTPKPFNNAFKISLGTNQEPGMEGQPTLNFEFTQLPDEEFNIPNTTQKGFVYISAPSKEKETVDDKGNLTTIARAGFFLEPGYYEKFSLYYPSLAPNTYAYLSYDYNNVPENVGGTTVDNVAPNLEANTTYSLTVTKSPGITITSPPREGGWDDEGDSFDIEVEEFLKAIYEKKGYQNKDGIDILEATANGCRLLHNVDFKFYDYANFQDKSFLPNIQEGAVFDGGQHYIDNIGSELFRYNYGTIQNLGVRTARITATSIEKTYESDRQDQSRHGALCAWNREMATISNVRVSDVTMTIKVDYINDEDDGSETHNIGCVMGSNTGTVNKVGVGGTFTLNVTGTNSQVNASVLIGGFVGQNAAKGNITDVSPYDEALSITINNTCIGPLGSYSIGGVVGESSGSISGVVLSRVTINGMGSKGVTSYIGGLAGQLLVSDDSSASSLTSCIISGSVTAGVTEPSGPVNSASYIGGIAGAVLNVQVVDCRTAVSVSGTSQALSQVLYATGGAFGRIRNSSSYKYEDLIVYGSVLQAPQNTPETGITNYVGNFAGVAPVGITESNFSGNNIIVRNFPSVSYIGFNMN